ncbi:class I SAM-dependent methyltransferase [Deinococcus yavapaiensis]|uniref:Methyltransferase family protein n=1 Tax=Deinococcus yavapaiensis KR-236 TaxID=694435 RepID=A0A318SE44_9DEIO|nr:methyltransferase [Deinococcus yavapaiensis]PYE55808.1 methyltransferase family protein [Deinococcus yavapaiensis KR-236]
MHVVVTRLRDLLARDGAARFLVPNPDLGDGRYPGEETSVGKHRPYSVWVDLADRLECRFLTPVSHGDFVELRFDLVERTSRDRSAGRYGALSDFQRVDKLEDPLFLDDMLEALHRVPLASGARVLHLGVNGGRELALLDLAFPDRAFDVVAVDVDDSALELARRRFPQHAFRVLNVNDLPDETLGTFDLVVALSVLQSPGVDTDRVFRVLLRDHLKPSGSVILGFPNCRYLGGEVSYGARLLNFRKPDLSLLVKDVALVRRHLQKHGFRVYVTGKYEVLVTGVNVKSTA